MMLGLSFTYCRVQNGDETPERWLLPSPDMEELERIPITLYFERF